MPSQKVWWEGEWLNLSGGGVSVPFVVSGFTATSGNAQVNLAWPAPSDGGSPITDYIIERAPDAAGSPGTWATLTDGVGVGLTYVDTTVVNDTTYWYRIFAVNSIGSSLSSTPIDVTPSETPVLEFDSFVTDATEGPRGWWDEGAGTYVQEWTHPYSNGFQFRALADILVHGARIWRPSRNTVVSDGDPDICLSLAGGARPILVSTPMLAGPPLTAQWETYMFDEPYPVAADAEMYIWVNSIPGTTSVPIARQADYFTAPTESINNLMEAMDPSGRYATPHSVDPHLTPWGEIATVWYWIDPLVTADT